MDALEHLQAQPGERILPKWQNLIYWIRRQQIQSPGARINYTPKGAQVLFDVAEYAPIVRFAVRLISTDPGKITVGEGVINGIVPKVNNVPITGSDNPPKPQPEIKLVEPDKDGICLVCIQTKHKSTGDLESATIVAKKPAELPAGMRADVASGINGFIPIALVRHDLQTKKPYSVFQNSTHNLQCRAYVGSGLVRVIYWPA